MPTPIELWIPAIGHTRFEQVEAVPDIGELLHIGSMRYRVEDVQPLPPDNDRDYVVTVRWGWHPAVEHGAPERIIYR